MNDLFTKASSQSRGTQAATYNEGLRQYMLSIYNYMAVGLVITGAVAFFASSSAAFLNIMYVLENGVIKGLKPLAWVIMLSPIAFALILNFRIHNMSLQSARISFFAFAFLMGLSLSSVFLTYTGTSIARVFFITAATFSAMSIYGYTTKRDLSGMGSFLMMGVIGLVIASLINIFLQSSALQFAVSVIGVLVFTGLTAYDTQKLKDMYYEVSSQGQMAAKLVIIGALSLYMDFINIFISLMHLLGERK